MAIQTYELSQLTYVVKVMFPKEPCSGIFCGFDLKAFANAFNFSSGVISGNSFAIKRLKNFGRDSDKNRVGYGADGEFDPSSPSSYLYYNEDLDE
jgi:hypothetical protein